MTGEQQTLEDVARLVAPTGAEVHHLCAAGVGTFSIAPQGGGTGDDVYALKVVGEPTPGPGRSESEFAALLRIVHPNAVRYRATGTQRHGSHDYRWLAMDFVNGSTLGQLLADGLVFDVATAARLLREAVAGAAALWDAGTTHRNLAADNVMITPSGSVVIVDLGLALGSDDAQRASTATFETLDGVQPTDDWRSDQFALGLLGYRMATGADASFHHNGDQPSPETRAPAPQAHDVNTAVPRPLSNVLAKMLAARPQDRYAEPAALESELENLARTLPPTDDHLVVAQSHGSVCQRHV